MGIQDRPLAMAFHEVDDTPSAMARGLAFAGPGGRLATLPDVVDARLATDMGMLTWTRYFTGLSTELVVSQFELPHR